MLERLLRIKEVAMITGEDPMTIYGRVRKGEIRGTRIGKRNVRVSESALRKWLKLTDPGEKEDRAR